MENQPVKKRGKNLKVIILVGIVLLIMIVYVTTKVIADSKKDLYCSSNEKMVGINANGSILCSRDLVGGSGGVQDEVDPYYLSNYSDIAFTNGNVVFNDNVTILGQLFGGSPIKMRGGINLLTGNLTITDGYIFGDGSKLTNLSSAIETSQNKI